MRKVLVSLMLLSLVPALAGAAVTNPEGFEGYALTTSWGPWDETGPQPDGWARWGELGDGDPTPAEDNAMGIAVSSVLPNTTQVLKVDSSGNGENLTAEWWQSTPDAAVSVTITSFEMSPVDVWSNQHRIGAMRIGADADWNGYYTWALFVGYGVWWGGGPGTPSATFRTWVSGNQGESPVFNILNLPFSSYATYEPGADQWWVIEVEEDNDPSGVGNGQSTRIRMYDKSTTPSAEDHWTDWTPHNATGEWGTDFANGGKVLTFTNGVVEWDNFSMTEDPGGGCNPGDANNDLLVSADDYASVQGAFGNTGAIGIPGDANCDGLVSADDYASVQGNFGTTYGGASVPEPAMMVLLGAGSLLLIRRRR